MREEQHYKTLFFLALCCFALTVICSVLLSRFSTPSLLLMVICLYTLFSVLVAEQNRHQQVENKILELERTVENVLQVSPTPAKTDVSSKLILRKQKKTMENLSAILSLCA